ncbi:MAG TPA: hypothetical protein DD664_01580, partial [Janibacter terrae]|nr:hypothetical protein [Janibacter terrae]
MDPAYEGRSPAPDTVAAVTTPTPRRDLAPALERVVVGAALWLVLLGFLGAVLARLGVWVPVIGWAAAVVTA